MVSLRSLSVLLLPILAVACASSTEDGDVATNTANLDTSGCSGLDVTQHNGPLTIETQRPPTASCWNVDETGLSLGYSWSQTNDSKPEKNGLSMWVGMNGASTTVQAGSASCVAQPGGGYEADTSGTTYYTCTAWARVGFHDHPDFKSAAYSNNHRTDWNVSVAVALPDGSWDSLGGANYNFKL